ncbi:MAG: MerR family transcriptional regulator [Actinomycetota bacterium]
MTGTRAHRSIGEVLSLLQEEFPDITISKIRFLESQGLLEPERTPSGYRKFFEPDVECLRWILLQQRDHFLPLRVIRERLETGEFEAWRAAGADPAALAPVTMQPSLGLDDAGAPGSNGHQEPTVADTIDPPSPTAQEPFAAPAEPVVATDPPSPPPPSSSAAAPPGDATTGSAGAANGSGAVGEGGSIVSATGGA